MTDESSGYSHSWSIVKSAIIILNYSSSRYKTPVVFWKPRSEWIKFKGRSLRTRTFNCILIRRYINNNLLKSAMFTVWIGTSENGYFRESHQSSKYHVGWQFVVMSILVFNEINRWLIHLMKCNHCGILCFDYWKYSKNFFFCRYYWQTWVIMHHAT